MIRHIVLWKLDEGYSTTEKAKLKETIKEKLVALKDHIQEVKHLAVYFNDTEANAANHEIMLDSEFESIEDLNAYQIHPEHVKVVEYVKSLKLQRAAIDFTK